MKKILFLVSIFLFVGSLAVSLAAEAPRISKEELKALMESGDAVIMDARSKAGWEFSDYKIKGAIRTPLDTVDEWLDSIPKDKTLVVYCS